MCVVALELSEESAVVETARLHVCGDVVDDILTFELDIPPRTNSNCSDPRRIAFSKFFRCQGFRWDHDESALKQIIRNNDVVDNYLFCVSPR